MYSIINKRNLNASTVLLEIKAPWIAQSAQPGQFVLIMNADHSERLPFGICATDPQRQSISIVANANCKRRHDIACHEIGDELYAVIGPLGNACPVVKNQGEQHLLLVCDPCGIAPIMSIAIWAHANNVKFDVLLGAEKQDDIVFMEELTSTSNELHIATNDAKNYIDNIADNLATLIASHNYSQCIATGTIALKKAVSLKTKELGLSTLVCMYGQTFDGSGMSGDGRVTVGGKVLSASIDGSFFDGHAVDFDEQERLRHATSDERYHHPITAQTTEHQLTDIVEPQKKERVQPQKQTPETRVHNFDEVNVGFTEEQAKLEASRCLNCPKPSCSMKGCPIHNRIPEFIHQIVEGNYEEAYKIISTRSTLPAICGRVCPHEQQCEGSCVWARKGNPLAIGQLERFVADWHREHVEETYNNTIAPDAKRVAIIGGGPSGMACAHDLAEMGYDVTIFEAMHEAGGVMIYGIPEFVLPKKVVRHEVAKLQKMGVKIETNAIGGKTVTVDDLMDNKGFDAVYIAAGAGLPRFMGIKGETLGGIMSANELLAKVTLMHANEEGYQTPLQIGKKVAVVGGGNVAIDAARVALRLGADVTIVYRRDEESMPARRDEIHYAKEENIHFCLQTNPVEFIGNEQGNVKAMRLVRMEMGEPDESGRRSFNVIEGSEYEMPIDNVFLALGSSVIPIVKDGASNVETDRKGLFTTDSEGRTNRAGVFAGGDIVSGPQTVVLAMGAGRKAAKAIDMYLRGEEPSTEETQA